MALIGTISGSNGTTTSAVTGSLIVASNPGLITPTKPAGVILFVSGAQTSIGADDPSIILKGDSFISGALGTDSYFQMKPVNTLRIPTNTTASYVYTSGSTNDVYFTQYNGPYTNTTRLRWLESGIGTGLLNGGTLSTANGTTTFSVVSGSGIIVTQNASLNSEPFPTINQVRWSNVVSQSLTYVASNQITYISVDSAGSITQSPNPLTIAQKESSIYLGRILHQTGSVTNGSITEPAISYGLAESTFNFQRAFGPLKISGHVLSVTASNGGTRKLGLNKTAGDTYAEGRNYTLNPNSPNLVLAADDPALTTSKIFREYTDASGDPVILNNGGVGYEEIDPSQYNNGGTLGSVGASEWSNQRVYWFPRSVNRALFVYYGPQKYGNFDDAIAGVSTETFTEGANTESSAIFLGIITVKGNETDLTVSTRARIIPAGLHRGAGTGGGGGGSTAPGGSDTYVQFNDGGGFGGDSGLTYNKTTDSLTVAGNITGSNMLLTSGLVVTGSGIIESNTSTAALRVTQQGTGNAITVEDSANPDSSPFVVAADGKVGIGTLSSSANLFVSGTDPVIPAFVAKGADVTVNTLTVTGSAGASTAVGFVNIDQGNYSNKYGLMISNIGAGTAGLKLSANTTGGSFAIDNMNTTPQITMTHKNLWFNSVSTAFDTSQVTYKFIENNKAATYPNQKTFLISGNTNGPKTGSYFEVEKSGSAGSIKIMELQGDTTDNALFISGSVLTSGSVFIAGDLAVSGGDITTTATTFNLITGSATTVNFAQSANTLNIGKLTGNVVISSAITASSPMLIGDTVTISGPSQATINSFTTTANVFNTTATTVNMGGAATTINLGSSSGRTFMNGNASISGSLTVTGSVAVNGGNITSTAATVNIANTTPTTINIGDNAANLYLGKTGANRVIIQGNLLLNNNEIQASGGAAGLTFPTGNAAAQFQSDLTIIGNLAVRGGNLTTNQTTFNLLNGTATTVAFGGAATSMKIASGSGTNVEIGSSSGRTTVYNDLAIGTGTIIGAPGSGANVMTLISSGNIIAKIDTDNSLAGHRFAVQDWRNIDQFFVGEDGNAELSGSLVVSGTTSIGTTVERLTTSAGSTGTVTFDTTFNSIFYVNGPAGDITANFTNVPTTNNNRVLTPTIILSQSATARVVSAVQVNSSVVPILWANKVTPVGTANQIDTFGFSLIRSGSAWTVLGQMSTYG